MTERCEACKFWLDVLDALTQTAVLSPSESVVVERERPTGMCRRYPQAVEKKPSEWCGEFKPRPLPTVK